MLIACTHTHTLPREACACASAAQSAMGPKAPKESKEIPESVKKFCRLYCKLYLKKYDPPVNQPGTLPREAKLVFGDLYVRPSVQTRPL
jgi:hypothetical protein